MFFRGVSLNPLETSEGKIDGKKLANTANCHRLTGRWIQTGVLGTILERKESCGTGRGCDTIIPVL